MIFAAGLGTRLRPLTDDRPKALVEVAGKPLLYHTIKRLKAAGATRVVVNVHHFAEQIVAYLDANDYFGLDVRISDERHHLLDTGGGLLKARQLAKPDEPLLVHNVDIFSNADLRAAYERAAADPSRQATLLVSERQTKRYLVFDDDRRMRGWTNIETGEVRSPRPGLDPNAGGHRLYAFSGIHIVSPALFPLLQEYAAANAPDGKFGITDFYVSACSRAHIVGEVCPGLRLLDVGKKETLPGAEAFLDEVTTEQP